MNNDQFDRALSYGKTAFGLLKKGKIPPHPRFYELFYTYAAGLNSDLNAHINAIFERGDTPDTQVVDELYNEFLQEQDVGERLNMVSAEIATRIDAVHEAIDGAHTNADNYSGLLQSAQAKLESGIDPVAMSRLTATLLPETEKMQATNMLLQDRLKSAHQDVTALQRELDEVRRESMIDPLTRIPNRKAFDHDLADAVERAERDGARLSLILLDIDHFKLFNDNYGHQTGDQVLRLVAVTLESSVAEGDTAARYGGEEFAAILPGTSLKDACAMGERLRKAVQSRELLKRSTNEKLGKITASLGVAAYRHGDGVASLVERADRCLYAAKHEGRNRVIDETHALPRAGQGKHFAA